LLLTAARCVVDWSLGELSGVVRAAKLLSSVTAAAEAQVLDGRKE
jgi:hypothetical protein